VDPPAVGNLGDFLAKYFIFRHVSAEILNIKFETCSLLYVSVLKFCILATILFECLLLDPSAGSPRLSRGG